MWGPTTDGPCAPAVPVDIQQDGNYAPVDCLKEKA
jgi:hypothetical protein